VLDSHGDWQFSLNLPTQAYSSNLDMACFDDPFLIDTYRYDNLYDGAYLYNSAYDEAYFNCFTPMALGTYVPFSLDFNDVLYDYDKPDVNTKKRKYDDAADPVSCKKMKCKSTSAESSFDTFQLSNCLGATFWGEQNSTPHECTIDIEEGCDLDFGIDLDSF